MKSSFSDGTPKTLIKSSRLQWEQLPSDVRSGIEDIMGSPVSVTSSQPGGYSPGTADRIVTKNGQRFFVKAVGSPINDTSPDIHRKEIRVMESLPENLLGSGLVGSYDDGKWVAIVFKDIDGRHPDLSDTEDRRLVMDALADLTANPLSDSVRKILPTLPGDTAYGFDAWQRLSVDPATGLDPWIENNFASLSFLSESASARLQGDFLAHTDLRKDNILIADNRAVIVDWPWAAAGVPWFDALTVTIDAGVYNTGFDPIRDMEHNPLFSTCSSDDMDSVIAGMMGYFFDSARKPSPPGIKNLRQFQQDEGMACLRILRERLGT